ncbi:DNA polymerase IV [Arundinibacter roseus]|uniref:DNA polymerase IV n=1 Tax=Arundinibacter roseus TaxID=2070510 RepID=A0A4R4KH05_9BACT|nr:DNA polymerase IV [Arundinibacter roseus]TDB67334.1 DNA polymerase IV [Arundinibacter roseus]
MERQVVHCDLDTFFVSVERLLNSSLTGKPVLIGGSSDRGVVASCSYEARQFGVHSAMPMRMARQLCPEAIVVRGDMDQYSKYSTMVTAIISEAAPLVEKASIDEHYIDITGMDRFFGCWKWTQELRHKIMHETGLPISFGLSVNKTVSKIATGEAKPCGEKKVDQGTEKVFLAPLSIRKIPSIGNKTYMQLRNMGISKVATLQQMPVLTMQKVLGANGVTIWSKANGLDDAPVQPFSERKSIGKEHTFQRDTIDIPVLHKTLHVMLDELTFELRRQKRLTSCLTLKIRYSNFDTHTIQMHVAYTSSERVLSEKALELFGKLYSRRMLILLIGVKLSGLVQGSHQVDLFEDTETDLNLSQALDLLRARYGIRSVVRGISF